MKFLVDASLSPRIAAMLRENGHQADHVRDYGRLTADDRQILAHARSHGQAIISADTDFTLMRSLRGVPSPSLVLLRSADRLTPPQQAALILANLAAVRADLEAGASVSIAQGRLRVRPLPLGREAGQAAPAGAGDTAEPAAT
jgi:predicted nuclease of predicted toxin-antitoxin system